MVGTLIKGETGFSLPNLVLDQVVGIIRLGSSNVRKLLFITLLFLLIKRSLDIEDFTQMLFISFISIVYIFYFVDLTILYNCVKRLSQRKILSFIHSFLSFLPGLKPKVVIEQSGHSQSLTLPFGHSLAFYPILFSSVFLLCKIV